MKPARSFCLFCLCMSVGMKMYLAILCKIQDVSFSSIMLLTLFLFMGSSLEKLVLLFVVVKNYYNEERSSEGNNYCFQCCCYVPSRIVSSLFSLFRFLLLEICPSKYQWAKFSQCICVLTCSHLLCQHISFASNHSSWNQFCMPIWTFQFETVFCFISQ